MGDSKTICCLLFLISYSSAQGDFRLPQTIESISYDLSLTIDPENTDYTGTVKISFRTTVDSTDVSIHSDGKSVVISSAKSKDSEDCSLGDPNEAGILIISCPTTMKQGEDNSLTLEFTGTFSEDGFGLVKSTYKDGSDTQTIIESNFKPTYARKAFPCLDEPDLKASFTVDITYPKGYTVISNTPGTDANKDDKQQIITFEKTPEISTYLLSIFLSQFKQADTSSVDNVDFKIFTRPSVATLTANVADKYYSQIKDKLDAFLGVAYEDLKDSESYLVAVPDYSDAMGDFGLFAYKETNLLDEGDKTTNRVKQNIITSMAYKLSHEWCGGDVATKWWSDVWANEAVSTYLKYVVSDEVDSELELTNQFLLEVNQKMLQNDGYQFAQPLSSAESEINSDWEIENKLNSENYEKGASILQMINVILGGKDQFEPAFQKYFNLRKDLQTDGTDILKELLQGQKDGDTDYYTYLKNWAFSAGYPLLTVSLQDNNGVDTDTIKINQKRFLYPTSGAVAFADTTQWYVPLTTATASSSSDIALSEFLKPDADLSLTFDKDQWVVLNSQGGCFYRVNYDERLWRRILDGLSSDRNSFHVLQRSQMVDDIFNIARLGDVSYSLAFEMADSLLEETEYYPWYSAFNVFSYLLGRMEDEETESKLKEYILSLMEKVIKIPTDKFIDDTDKHVDVLKKVLILKWACELGHDGCISYAKNQFNSYKSSSSLDDNNPRKVIFCNGIRHSDKVEDDFTFLWQTYSDSQSVHEQSDILNALGCTENQNLLQSYLEKIVTADSGIKKQDATMVFKSVFSSSLGLEVAKKFLKDNLSKIQTTFNDMRILTEMIHAVAEKLTSDDDAQWLNDLLGDTILDDYEDVKTKANTLASVNNYWLNTFQSEITTILSPVATDSSTSSESSSSTEESSSTQSSPIKSSTVLSSTILEESTTTEESSTTDQSSSTDWLTSTDVYSTTESKSPIIVVSEYILLFVVILALLG